MRTTSSPRVVRLATRGSPLARWQTDHVAGLIRARQMLNEYEEPKLDAGVNEALLDYIARREREIPAADALNQEY